MIVKTFFHGRLVMTSKCTDGPGGRPCDVCREASSLTRRRWRKARQEAIARDPSLRPHGNITTYQNWGCRCDKCRAVGTALRYSYVYDGELRANGYTKRAVKGGVRPFGREWLDDDNDG